MVNIIIVLLAAALASILWYLIAGLARRSRERYAKNYMEYYGLGERVYDSGGSLREGGVLYTTPQAHNPPAGFGIGNVIPDTEEPPAHHHQHHSFGDGGGFDGSGAGGSFDTPNHDHSHGRSSGSDHHSCQADTSSSFGGGDFGGGHHHG